MDTGNRKSDAADADSEEFAPVVELAEAFTELVTLFTERESVTLSADGLVRLAVRCMPHAEHTGLTVLERGRLRAIAGTGPVVEGLEQIRSQTGQGPALDVLDVNELVYSGDLADDPRWSQFGARAAAELGVRSVASYRLYLGPEHRAALTFSSDWPFAFDDVSLAVGAIFAAYCSLVLFTDLVLRDELHPRRAAQVHREIGVAVGILLGSDAGDGMDAHRAYCRLRDASLATRRSLHQVAAEVIAHRRLPPDARGCERAEPEQAETGSDL